MEFLTQPVAALLAAFLGAVVGTILKGMWDRRLAKKAPKTDRRAEAYKDFVVFFLVPDKAGLDLNEIKARLMIFGESKVVCSVADFLKTSHESLDSSEARTAFREVIKSMRESVATSSHDVVMTKIGDLLSPAAKSQG